MLNCKQGDLAVIVRSACGNEGVVLRCLRYVGEVETLTAQGHIIRSPTWATDKDVVCFNGRVDCLVEDRLLRPLRDSDGEDEVLRLVGRPVGTPQAA